MKEIKEQFNENFIDLSKLPRWKKGLKINMGKINWERSIGYMVNFICENIEGIIEIIDYNKNKLLVRYNDKQYKISTSGFTRCKLGNIIGTKTSQFKYEIEKIFIEDKRHIEIVDREYRPYYNKKNNKLKQNKKWYKYKCCRCGYEGWIEENNLKTGQGCSVCCKAPRTVVPGINDIPTTAPWMVKYFKGGYNEAKLYTTQSNKKIYPICPDCGRIKTKQMSVSTICVNNSIPCSCNDGISMPNKMMFSILEQLDIEFKTEYAPEWIKPKRYDFYIPSLSIIIEMDGSLGHGNGEKGNESKAIDDYKDEQAKLHGVEVIRIDCAYGNKEPFNYIKQNILQNKKLNIIFDFNTVDWLRCEEFILNNLVKIACEYKRNNPILTTSEIGIRMKINYQTIRKWLKIGNELKWCVYDAKTESMRIKEKPLICIENGIIFNSTKDCERKSMKIFKMKLLSGNVSAVCNKNLKQLKGYHFKYTQDLTEEQIKEIQENANLNQVL